MIFTSAQKECGGGGYHGSSLPFTGFYEPEYFSSLGEKPSIFCQEWRKAQFFGIIIIKKSTLFKLTIKNCFFSQNFRKFDCNLVFYT